VRAGADGVFIESMLNEEEMARAAREVDTVHVANMGPHYREMIEAYGREVLPAVR